MKKLCLLLLGVMVFTVPALAKDEDWNKYDSRYFLIYYKNAPLDFVKTVSETAEEYYEQIPRNLGFYRYEGWIYDKRALIYIYDDQDEYKTHAKNLEWSGGMANPMQKMIWTFPAAAGFFDSTLPHELAHLIFREYIGYSQIPLWLDEGVAMYQEKAKRWGANKYVAKLIEDNKFVPLEQLTYELLRTGKSEEIINIFYAEAASIVYYMIVELGEARFENFCRKLKDKISFTDALDETYPEFHNIKELNNRWIDYLKSQSEK